MSFNPIYFTLAALNYYLMYCELDFVNTLFRRRLSFSLVLKARVTDWRNTLSFYIANVGN